MSPATINHQTNPRLPPPFDTSPEPLTLISQGAEALLYRTTFLQPSQSTPPSDPLASSNDTKLTPLGNCALKIRLPKPWRHPTLDARLTRQRVLAEARVLLKCAREGVRVPAVMGLSWEEGWVAAEWIEGGMVKEAIRKRDTTAGEEGLKSLMRRIGRAVGKLHAVGVVHGDLTTSNMMLQRDGQRESTEEQEQDSLAGSIVLIDFGLAAQTVQEEDRAVDLYVLERAFGSTHPREEGMFGEVLEGYAEAFPKGAKGTLRRLEDVRMRGRKKSMIG